MDIKDLIHELPKNIGKFKRKRYLHKLKAGIRHRLDEINLPADNLKMEAEYIKTEEEFPVKELNESKTKSARDYVYDACKTAWEAGQLDEDLLRYIFEDLEEDNIPYDKEEVTDYFYKLLNNREF